MTQIALFDRAPTTLSQPHLSPEISPLMCGNRFRFSSQMSSTEMLLITPNKRFCSRRKRGRVIGHLQSVHVGAPLVFEAASTRGRRGHRDHSGSEWHKVPEVELRRRVFHWRNDTKYFCVPSLDLCGTPLAQPNLSMKNTRGDQVSHRRARVLKRPVEPRSRHATTRIRTGIRPRTQLRS